MMMADPRPLRPLRILALHSFRTSAAIFEDQLRRSGLLTGGEDAGDLKFVGVPAVVRFLDAPNAATGAAPPDVVAGAWPPPYREWFAATRVDDKEDDEEREREADDDAKESRGSSCHVRRRSYVFEGLDASERLIASALLLDNDGAGYDGIIGFSQGAAMGAAMVATQMAVMRTGGALFRRGGPEAAAGGKGGGDPWAHVRPELAAARVSRFVVCIGAAMAPHPRHLLAFRVLQQKPGEGRSGGVGGAAAAAPSSSSSPLFTAHVIGDNDPVRPFSERLAAAFPAPPLPLVLRHPRGHVVPRLAAAQVRRLEVLLLLRPAFGSGGGDDGGVAGQDSSTSDDDSGRPPPPRSRL
jgi:hypothetical protein